MSSATSVVKSLTKLLSTVGHTREGAFKLASGAIARNEVVFFFLGGINDAEIIGRSGPFHSKNIAQISVILVTLEVFCLHSSLNVGAATGNDFESGMGD